MLKLTGEFGERVNTRLTNEGVAWLVTVDAAGMPQPSPIWFFWENETLTVYSQPNTPKITNITNHPQVAVHLDSDGRGGNIVTLTGTAEIVANAQPANENSAYVAKYAAGISSLGLTPESFAKRYSTAIRITPTKLRGH